MSSRGGSLWPTRRLGEVAAKIQDGTHFSPTSTSGPFRYVTSQNVRLGHLDLSRCGWITEAEHRNIYRRCDPRKDDLLLTKDGANTGNVALNTLDEEFSLLSSVAMIRFDQTSHDPRFFLQYLASPQVQARLKDQMSGNAITRLTLAKIKDFAVPVPPLRVQCRIAEILDSVDESIRSTECLLTKIGQFKNALACDLIERISANGSRLALGCLLTGIEAGKSPDVPDRPARHDEWGVLKVSAVRNQTFEPTENKVVTQWQFFNKRIEVQPGDLLITRANTPELVGLACYVRETRPRLMLSDKTLRLVVNSDKVDSEYLAYVLATPSLRRQIESSGTGSSGSMKNISQLEIRSLIVPCPQIEDQRLVAARIRATAARAEVYQHELAKLRELKQGLMEDLLTGRVRVGDVERAGV